MTTSSRVSPAVRLGAALAVVAFTGLAASPIRLRAGYEFRLEDVTAREGERATVEVSALYDAPVQGFSFSAAYPSASFRNVAIDTSDTILEALDVDFVESRVGDGHIVVAVLVDARPPFEGGVLPAIGRALEVFRIDGTVATAAEEDSFRIEMVDGLGAPPVLNAFSVADEPVRVDALAAATVTIERDARFLRGDSTMDGERDVSDPIRILEWQFRGGVALPCEDAADANDDDRLDLSDAIYLLEFFFLGGAAPPAPADRPGPDPTPGPLGCVYGA